MPLRQHCLLAFISSLLLIGLITVGLEATPPVTATAISPDGNAILSVSQSGLKKLTWPTLTHQQTYPIPTANLNSIAFSPNGSALLLAGGNPADTAFIGIYSWPELKPLHQIEQPGDSILTATWLSNLTFVTGSLDNKLMIWNAESGQSLQTLSGHSRGITSLRYLARQNLLVSGGLDNSIRVWSLSDNRLLRSLTQHTHPVTCIAECPSEEGLPLIATAAEDRTVRFWQPTIGRMMRFIRLPARPLAIVWVNETILVATCNNGMLYTVDTLNVEVVKSTATLPKWVYALTYDRPRGLFALAGSDGKLSVQNLSTFSNTDK